MNEALRAELLRCLPETIPLRTRGTKVGLLGCIVEASLASLGPHSTNTIQSFSGIASQQLVKRLQTVLKWEESLNSHQTT